MVVPLLPQEGLLATIRGVAAAYARGNRAIPCPYCAQEVLQGQRFCFSFENDYFFNGNATLPSTVDLDNTASTVPRPFRYCGICLELLARDGLLLVAFVSPGGYCHQKHCVDALIRQSTLMSLPCQCRNHVVEGKLVCYLFETDPTENVENDDTDTGLPADGGIEGDSHGAGNGGLLSFNAAGVSDALATAA
jgi:hypothetical protein